MKKEISLNIRVSKELHENLKKEAIKQSLETNELITISRVIRKILKDKII